MTLATLLSFPKGVCALYTPGLQRWLKFNLVGALGMGVQLASLALFSRCFPNHLLLASAIAVELTLLHNLTWHMHYTWRDRCDSSSRLQQFMRFHLSTGLISLTGNLALMHLLLHHAHLPLLLANVVTILCCSAANFVAGNRWAFASAASPITTGTSTRHWLSPAKARKVNPPCAYYVP